MYFVATGKFRVKVKDRDDSSNKEDTVGDLLPGDHFGEIALIYNCCRTATVLSSNYSTLAKLNAKKFNEIVFKYPDIISSFKEKIYEYSDEMKMFLESSLDKISYL